MFEKRSLGIAFEADGTVRGAELISSMRSATLTRTWTVRSEGDDVFSGWKRGIDSLREAGVDLDNAVVGIPESLVYRKHLSFPFNSRKRVMQILNSELDGEIPLPVDDVVADFIAGYSPGAGLTGTAVACDTETVSRFLEIFGPGVRLRSIQTSSVGLAVASISAGMKEGVSVFGGGSEAVLIEIRSSKVKAIKRLALSGSVDESVELLADAIRQHTVNEDEVYLGYADAESKISGSLSDESTLRIRFFSDLDIIQSAAGVDTDKGGFSVAIGLASSGLGIGEFLNFDLRQGPFKQVTPLAGLKGPIFRTSGLLLAVGLLAFASLITSFNHTRGEYQFLKNQLEREFKELFPGSRDQNGQEAGYIKGELDKLKRRMSDLSGIGGQGALVILAGLSAAIPDEVSLKLDELSYDSKKIRFEGSVTSFDTVDRIKAALDSNPMFTDVQVQNARVGANINKVTFRVQMEVR